LKVLWFCKKFFEKVGKTERPEDGKSGRTNHGRSRQRTGLTLNPSPRERDLKTLLFWRRVWDEAIVTALTNLPDFILIFRNVDLVEFTIVIFPTFGLPDFRSFEL